ncbi:MAG: hypothetical protein HYZ29_07415 [Myxococcales bacterium]|nr:hypothetical protein [Myxococcales bacterium]
MGGRLVLLAILLGVPACDSGGSDAASSGGPGGLEALPEIELWGHLRHDPMGLATAATPGPLSFDAIRQSTARPHALIHVSGFT